MTDLSDVLFFNVALKDGHIMSRPKFEPQQEFIGSLVHEIETINPEFAWIQFIFMLKDYTKELTALKSNLLNFKFLADTPLNKRDGKGKIYTIDRKEKQTEWYRTIEVRTKKVDEAKSAAKLIMGIQGMWVCRDTEPAKTISLNTFAKCRDEIDSLAMFLYRDPRMLIELVSRRLVSELGHYFMSYNRSRREPPSLVLTQDELPYYIHLPSGSVLNKLSSITTGVAVTASIEDEPFVPAMETPELSNDKQSDSRLTICRANTVPRISEPLAKDDVSRLQGLASNYARSFEIMYENSKTIFLMSSESKSDLELFKKQMLFLYGGMEFEETDRIPAYLHILADLLISQEKSD